MLVLLSSPSAYRQVLSTKLVQTLPQKPKLEEKFGKDDTRSFIMMMYAEGKTNWSSFSKEMIKWKENKERKEAA